MFKSLKYILPFYLLLNPGIILATQAHGQPEGIYAHQFAHLFFMISMLIFIYWLRQKKLTRLTGWRFIQYASMFFIVWNFAVIWVHFLDEQAMLVTVQKVSAWRIRIDSPFGNVASVSYYICKMDHLFCVPALLFLYAGLKRLSNDSGQKSGEDA